MNPRPLDYEPQRVLYRGSWSYRSWRGALALFIFAIFLVGGLTIGWIGLGMPAAPAVIARTLAGVCIIAGLYGMGMALVGVWYNRHETFEIRSDGISSCGRVCPWSDVRRFAAHGPRDGALVRLFYEGVNGVPHRLAHDGLTPDCYEQLVAALREELCARWPALQLGGYFPDPGE